MGLEFTTEVHVTCPHCHEEFDEEVDINYEPSD
jgi:hypothetical protein